MKRFIKRSFNYFGLEIKRHLQIGWNSEHLRKLCPSVETIVDVGVENGTHELYAAFLEKKFLLVEPLKEFEPGIREILTRYDGDYYLGAVGERSGQAEINVQPQFLGRSSLRKRLPKSVSGTTMESRMVNVSMLDSLANDYRLKKPYGLKIDAEGHELRVLEGAPQFLQDTRFIIAEVSVGPRFEDSYRCGEFIAYVEKLGFALCDILSIARSHEHEFRINQMDAVFLREGLI